MKINKISSTAQLTLELSDIESAFTIRYNYKKMEPYHVLNKSSPLNSIVLFRRFVKDQLNDLYEEEVKDDMQYIILYNSIIKDSDVRIKALKELGFKKVYSNKDNGIIETYLLDITNKKVKQKRTLKQKLLNFIERF